METISESLIRSYCSCYWGYEDGHDICEQPDPDCLMHGHTKYATQSADARAANEAIQAAEAR